MSDPIHPTVTYETILERPDYAAGALEHSVSAAEDYTGWAAAGGVAALVAGLLWRGVRNGAFPQTGPIALGLEILRGIISPADEDERRMGRRKTPAEREGTNRAEKH